MGLCLKKVVTEKQVTKAWQELLKSGCQMETERGQSLRVIYPGKNSDAPGSDFQDAVINIGRNTFKGNIEIHLNSSGWRSHQHHLDPAYNHVVLHVALQRDCPGNVMRQNGDTIPAVIIGKYFRNDTRNTISAPVPCTGIARDAPDTLLKIIDIAGAARFSEKAVQFQVQLQQRAAGECLYLGVMAALGYVRNQAPFRELAGRVPLSVLESVIKRENGVEPSLISQQARLLGTAGFLPSQRPEIEYSPWENYGYVKKLETAWETIKQKDVMDFSVWQPFRVRPANSPLRRIAGMCLLIRRYGEKGLLSGLLELVGEVPSEKGSRLLEKGLMAADDGYWAGRYDFGKGYPGLSKWLIGQSRAADMVINVLLPFVYTCSRENGQKELAEKAYALYLAYPPVETNTIERHMRTQFGLKNAQVNSARRQQGLLHLYKRWCTQGRCGECEVVSGKKTQ
jgi:hypothetical protein